LKDKQSKQLIDLRYRYLAEQLISELALEALSSSTSNISLGNKFSSQSAVIAASAAAAVI
jgi:hypothetical protein